MQRVLLLAVLLALALRLEPGPEESACAQTRSDAAVASHTARSSAPAYVQRGDAVEARYRAYRERLQGFYETLQARVRSDAPDLLPQIEAAAPKAVLHGYQILPRIVADAPVPLQRPRAKSAWYSWPRTEQLIERALLALAGLEAQLDRLSTRPAAERRAIYEQVVADYHQLPRHQRTIDAHMQYNRLWQSAIARDKPTYDRTTALHDMVLERQAILDALSATDAAAFHQALSGIRGIDGAKAREALESELQEREQGLAREIHAATDAIMPPSFVRVEHPTPHLWIVHVPFYTDIADAEFVRSFQSAVESVWRVRDGEDECRVQLAITAVPVIELYGQRTAPDKGAPIDLQHSLRAASQLPGRHHLREVNFNSNFSLSRACYAF